jgi:hypothetical protein
MVSRMSRLVLCHALLIGASVSIVAALGSSGLDDPLARSVLITVSSLAAAVGSGITAFIMLNVERDDGPRAKQKRPQSLQGR